MSKAVFYEPRIVLFPSYYHLPFLQHCAIAQNALLCAKLQLAMETMVTSPLHVNFVSLDYNTD